MAVSARQEAWAQHATDLARGYVRPLPLETGAGMERQWGEPYPVMRQSDYGGGRG